MKTVRVRILVAVTDDGSWIADGSCIEGASHTNEERTRKDLIELAKANFDPPIELHWIEAEIPIPAPLAPTTIQAIGSVPANGRP